MRRAVTAVVFGGLSLLLYGADDPRLPTAEGPAVLDGYELSWAEEFNGTGVPDSSVWGYELGRVRNNEWQTYTTGNAACADGRLVITTKKEGAVYTSSSLITLGRKHFLYGRYVIRARIPVRRGAWPCIWMMGVSGSWPSGGEIDIEEMYWKNWEDVPQPVLLSNLCWNKASGKWDPAWNTTSRPVASLNADGADVWSAAYHVWTMDWDEDRIVIHLDDRAEPLVEQDLSKAINEGEWGEGTKGKCPFRSPQYILLNLPIGGDAGGACGVDPSIDVTPWTMEVDYIRVYRKTGTGGGLQPVRAPEMLLENGSEDVVRAVAASVGDF